jgi:hypothetical protein
MTTPVQLTRPRLDDLIDGLTKAHDDPLDQLAGAMVLADHLGELADHLIGHFVDQARRSGRSWTEIGHSMGVTKQAARKRFVPKDPGAAPDLDHGQGFGRFTHAARRIVVAAQNEAHDAGHAEITPGHLTLGLLADPGALAARTIVALGVPLESLRPAVAPTLPAPSGEPPRALVPFDEAAKKALELTFREALRLEDDYVGSEHVLLALLEVEDGSGTLTGLGIDKAAAETHIATAEPDEGVEVEGPDGGEPGAEQAGAAGA